MRSADSTVIVYFQVSIESSPSDGDSFLPQQIKRDTSCNKENKQQNTTRSRPNRLTLSSTRLHRYIPSEFTSTRYGGSSLVSFAELISVRVTRSFFFSVERRKQISRPCSNSKLIRSDGTQSAQHYFQGLTERNTADGAGEQ